MHCPFSRGKWNCPFQQGIANTSNRELLLKSRSILNCSMTCAQEILSFNTLRLVYLSYLIFALWNSLWFLGDFEDRMGHVGVELRQSLERSLDASIWRFAISSAAWDSAETNRKGRVSYPLHYPYGKVSDIEIYSVTVFGTSPRYMAELRTRNIIPSKTIR